jgi:tetratricopeptide (TPR) repeat protein
LRVAGILSAGSWLIPLVFLVVTRPSWAGDGSAGEPEASGLVVGAEVVLTDPSTSIRAGDRTISPRGERLFRVERLDAGLAAITTSDRMIQGWVNVDQILPLDRAAEHFTRRIAAAPKDVDAYLARAAIKLEGNECDRALVDLDTAVRLAPTDARGFQLRGQVRARTRQFDQAIADFTEAIRIDPTSARAFLGRGLAWDQKRYFDKALADLNEAVRIEPGNPALVLSRGKVCSSRGRHRQAMMDFEWVIRTRPNETAGYVARGEELMEDLQADSAIADFSRALELDPACVSALLLRAKAWKRKSDLGQAIADHAEAVRRAPDNAQAHQTLAWILATCPGPRFRDGRRAVQEGTLACELTQWKNPLNLNSLAAACAESGDYTSAVKWQTRAVELLPIDDPIRPLFRRRLFIYEARHPYRD